MRVIGEFMDKIIIQTQCRNCGKIENLTLNIDDWDNYQAGELIQNCFPYLTPNQRETMISDICGECFDNMFKYDENETPEEYQQWLEDAINNLN